MTAPFRLSAIAFTSGVEISVADADIIVFVGPNNSGKSMSLREIVGCLSNSQQPGSAVAVKSVATERNMSGAELGDWYRRNRAVIGDGTPGASVKSFQTRETRLDQLSGEWDHQVANNIAPLPGNSPHLVKLLACDTRLAYEGQSARQETGATPDSLVQWLVHTPEAMAKFSGAFHKAFGYNVIVDAWGASIRLRLSKDREQESFSITSNSGLPNSEMVTQLSALPLIENQSDGVRSFASVLQHLAPSSYPVVLIDEPEAFLHPPQARLMGRNLAEFQSGQQVLVATHSLDVLLGLLDAGKSRVQVIRLVRQDGTTAGKSLDNDQLRRLWSDPLLRFSRVLDGLFHRGVVACEGDSDSHFYSVVAEETLGGLQDVMFTYAGGKQRLALIARSLAAVGVPVRCATDFDLLNDRQTTVNLVEALGGTFSEQMNTDLNVLSAALRGSEPALTLEAAATQIQQILGEEVKDVKALMGKIQDALKPQTGWRAAKKQGVGAIPNGAATAAANRLLAELKQRGLFVIPVGEVESFVPEVGGHGPAWVVAVVEGDHLKGAELAQKFVSEMLASFA
jgi:energy-coupling factor transporter ATP-binding protein EcfA2